eukprot:TRINITY_DN64630_c0_g1_i1.p1 TRINITY_DN64630_c0_g1~~TRINITY_DN64630_c0_g1_i1.p1  ORF type:complete len:592 (+),score=105.03 TRINITY_DN64630_c0_g1_i1:184-1959(+)
MGAHQSRHADSQSFQIGQFVQLQGNGRRWEGQLYGAKIVDIRASDDTIKVQYMDGGFKRFSSHDFKLLVSARLQRKLSCQDLHVGQRVYLSGTGKRWAGQRFGAMVQDIRESDSTVKVRYLDGGFKRFSLAELEMLLVEQATETFEKWHVGQHIYISGTGKWWTGSNCGATIVDIRHSDSTVKVRYTDGGYKRLSTEEFKSLVTEQQAAPEMWEEWHASTPEEQSSEMDKLHDEIVLAARKKNDKQVAELEKRFQAMSMHRDEVAELRLQLTGAVHRGDYLEAHRIQEQINEVSGKPVHTLATPPQLESSWAADLTDVLQKSANRALCGGLAGASAMVLQVTSLMWLRTTMNYQYRYGLSMSQALRTLYAQGGLARFYQGLGPALVQGPLTRFGDSAANAGVLAFFDGTEARHWPVWVKTIFASTSASLMRIALLPVDALKTVMQVEGKQGRHQLVMRWRIGGASVFYRGAMASSAATFVSHYPWFTVFNTLNNVLPNYDQRPQQLLRNAGIGFCASVCSDTVANSLRVLKTHRQTGEQGSYLGIAKNVIRSDGVLGLLSRGLATRIVANGCSGMVFSVLYRLFEEPLVAR